MSGLGEWNITFHEVTQEEIDRLGLADKVSMNDGGCVVGIDSHTTRARTIAVCDEYGTAHVVEADNAKHTDMIELAVETAMELYAKVKWGGGETRG